MTKAKKTAARSRAKARALFEVSIENLDAMDMALTSHIHSDEVDVCLPLDKDMAHKIRTALALLKRILQTGRLKERPTRASQKNLLAACVVRDMIRYFHVPQEAAVEAVFPNPAGIDLASLARTYRNLTPKLNQTKWKGSDTSNLAIMFLFAAGLGGKPMKKSERQNWATRARSEFQNVLNGGTIKPK